MAEESGRTAIASADELAVRLWDRLAAEDPVIGLLRRRAKFNCAGSHAMVRRDGFPMRLKWKLVSNSVPLFPDPAACRAAVYSVLDDVVKQLCIDARSITGRRHLLSSGSITAADLAAACEILGSERCFLLRSVDLAFLGEDERVGESPHVHPGSAFVFLEDTLHVMFMTPQAVTFCDDGPGAIRAEAYFRPVFAAEDKVLVMSGMTKFERLCKGQDDG